VARWQPRVEQHTPTARTSEPQLAGQRERRLFGRRFRIDASRIVADGRFAEVWVVAMDDRLRESGAPGQWGLELSRHSGT